MELDDDMQQEDVEMDDVEAGDDGEIIQVRAAVMRLLRQLRQ